MSDNKASDGKRFRNKQIDGIGIIFPDVQDAATMEISLLYDYHPLKQMGCVRAGDPRITCYESSVDNSSVAIINRINQSTKNFETAIVALFNEFVAEQNSLRKELGDDCGHPDSKVGSGFNGPLRCFRCCLQVNFASHLSPKE